MKNFNVGDTVYFVAEHHYYMQDKAAPRMEYLPVKGTIESVTIEGSRPIMVKCVIDRITKLFLFESANCDKRLFRSYTEAMEAARRETGRHDRKWSGILGERMRCPWEQTTEDGEAGAREGRGGMRV